MSWKSSRLSDLCSDIYSGGTPTSSNAAYYGGDIPWLRTQEVTFNRIRETELAITEAGYENSAAKWVPAKSVIVAMYGNSAGRSAISEIPLTTNQACCNLVIDPARADYRFVFYALLLRYEELKGLAKGAAQNNLNASQVKGFEVPIPPRVEEQQRIADMLSTYDDLIENNRRRIALLEQSARLLYREWFVHLRFPGHEHVKVVDGVPEGWARRTVSELATLAGGKQYESDKLTDAGAYPVFGGNGIQGYSQEKTHDDFVIAFGRVGAYCGSVHWSYEGAWINNNASSLVPHEYPELFLHHMLHCDFRNYRKGAAQPFIPNGVLSTICFIGPSGMLAAEFCEQVRFMRLQQVILAKQNKKLAQARDLLLPRLMSGELVV